MTTAKHRAWLASVVATSLVVAGCSSLIGVPDVPQPADAGEDAGGGPFDAPQGSPDSSQGTDAPGADDAATPVVDAGGG